MRIIESDLAASKSEPGRNFKHEAGRPKASPSKKPQPKGKKR
jgi:hypothetical protein